jgi:hypothetical protein
MTEAGIESRDGYLKLIAAASFARDAGEALHSVAAEMVGDLKQVAPIDSLSATLRERD